MLYPYENYLKALIIKGLGNAPILERFQSLRLTPPDEAELDDKREDILRAIPDDAIVYITPGDRYNFNLFLEKAKSHVDCLDISEAVPLLSGKRDKDWEDALFLIADPVTSPLIMSSMVYGNSDEEVLALLESKHHFAMSLRTISLFRKYFWNTQVLTKLELYHYISRMSAPKTRCMLMDAFHKKDTQLKWRLTGENLLTLEEILTEVMNEAFIKFKSSVTNDDTDSVNKVIRWAELAMKAAEKYKAVTNKHSENLVATLEFQLKKMSQADIKPSDKFDGDVM